MPSVPIQPRTRESLIGAADERWDAIRRTRADLGPAIDLQRALVSTVIDLANTIDRGRMPRLSLPPKYLAAKLARGVPALAGEPIPLPVAVLKMTVLELCDRLSKGGAGEVATHIADTIDSGRLDAGSLLTASLARDQA